MLLDANEITPGLWQGGFPPPGDLVRASGFQVLVLCARELQVPATDFPGVQVIHAPNDDHDKLPLTREKLRIALAAAHEVVMHIQSGQRVLVTCAAGLNRSGLVSGLSLHLLYGWNGVTCIAHVRKHRPESASHPGHGALSNGDFVRALTKLGPTEPVRLCSTGPLIWMPG